MTAGKITSSIPDFNGQANLGLEDTNGFVPFLQDQGLTWSLTFPPNQSYTIGPKPFTIKDAVDKKRGLYQKKKNKYSAPRAGEIGHSRNIICYDKSEGEKINEEGDEITVYKHCNFLCPKGQAHVFVADTIGMMIAHGYQYTPKVDEKKNEYVKQMTKSLANNISRMLSLPDFKTIVMEQAASIFDTFESSREEAELIQIQDEIDDENLSNAISGSEEDN